MASATGAGNLPRERYDAVPLSCWCRWCPWRLASARASTEATVARVETATLRQAIKDHPELSERFIAFLLLRNSQIESDLVDQLFNSSEKRLARALLLLANFGKEGRPEPIAAKISQSAMAASPQDACGAPPQADPGSQESGSWKTVSERSLRPLAPGRLDIRRRLPDRTVKDPVPLWSAPTIRQGVPRPRIARTILPDF